MKQSHYKHVHKFGGSSLANAKRFNNALSLIPETPSVVVVSAVQNITSKLQTVIDRAREGKSVDSELDEIEERHLRIIKDLQATHSDDLVLSIKKDMAQLKTILTTIKLVRHYSSAEQAEILGFGERSSAKILSAMAAETRSSAYLDASDCLFIKNRNNAFVCDIEKSSLALSRCIAKKKVDVLVITGFLSRDEDGHKALLDRNGSDVSASYFAELLKAETLTIWSDQSGIYTSDPRVVPMAFPIPHMSYDEALELAYFGTKILHPNTIAPAKRSNRPIRIKNSLIPSEKGTLISADSPQTAYPIRGLTSIASVSLITIEGSGMLGIAGVSARLFSSLAEAQISVIFISQASSEHSICLCVSKEQGADAKTILNSCFDYELKHKMISQITLTDEQSIVAVVGDGMAHRTGIAGKVCNTLGKAMVSIRAIAQGASERNISLVIDNRDLEKALKALHSGFYLGTGTIAIGLIGAGVVGTELLSQLASTAEYLDETKKIRLHLRGIMNSSQMALFDTVIPIAHWKAQFEESSEPSDLKSWLEHMRTDNYPHTVIIDCTASSAIAEYYPAFFENGMHVITPNKQANSGSWERYQEIRECLKQYQRHFLYEATVCAGLPIMTTLQDIINTGDTVFEIQGVVSGSLNFIFHQMGQGRTFSEAILDAKNNGYTEPDPRDDLSGRDVARKMITLAREIGISISMHEIQLESLVPERATSLSREDFLHQLPEFDSEFNLLIHDRCKPNQKLSYVGKICAQSGEVTIGIEAFNNTHPFAQLNGTDNILIFRTQRYDSQHLIVRGPGAGAAVTASGIYADLIRLTSSLTS